MRVLVIAAHPDDETYGVGGTILKHISKGDNVSVLIMSDGVTARHAQIKKQMAAAQEACKILGTTDVDFVGLPDQRLDSLPLLEVIRPIEKAIIKLKPEIVYTHHGGDVNQDHRVVFEATLVAGRPVGKHIINKIFSYEVPSSTEWAPPFVNWVFTPNIFENISPFVDQKLAALKPYQYTHEAEVKQSPHPRSLEAVRISSQQRGLTVGMEAAEAFMLVREVRE